MYANAASGLRLSSPVAALWTLVFAIAATLHSLHRGPHSKLVLQPLHIQVYTGSS